MKGFTQGYHIVIPELVALKAEWPSVFESLKWPRGAKTIQVALADAHVIFLVFCWLQKYRSYDQKIAWEGKAIDERQEDKMNQRLSYWSLWDAQKVREMQIAAYVGFLHPTESQCQEQERKAASMNEAFERNSNR